MSGTRLQGELRLYLCDADPARQRWAAAGLAVVHAGAGGARAAVLAKDLVREGLVLAALAVCARRGVSWVNICVLGRHTYLR